MKNFGLILFLLLTSLSYAQQTENWCHTHSKTQEFWDANPEYLLEKSVLDKFRNAYVEKHRFQNKTVDPLIVIPTVVHVVHEYGSENISYSEIVSAINNVNDDFRKRKADSASIEPPFNLIHPDTRIELRLATIDPAGNCTQGVNRIFSPLHTNAGSDDMKFSVAPTWDRSKYLNVWIVKRIASGAGGYSFTPPIDATRDGIVILAGQMSSLTHELGHYLGLNHPWGPTNDPNEASNCGWDDQIDDTPNTIGATNCDNLTPNSCPGDPIPFLKEDNSILWPAANGEIHDNVQNYMGYAFCNPENYTEGQKLYMRGTLNSSVSARNNLWTDMNRDATGTADSSNTIGCIPVADFTYDNDVICQDGYVSFTNLTHNAIADTFVWDFGDGTTSNEEGPVHQFTTAGTYDVNLKAINAFGEDEILRSDIITILPTTGGEIAPFYESFETQGFPNISPMAWSMTSTTGQKFFRTTNASRGGTASVALNMVNLGSDETIEMITPTIDLSDASNCSKLTYNYAYAQRNTVDLDELSISASKNCGETWTPLYFTSGSQMKTSNEDFINTTFVPEIDEWEYNEVSLSAFVGRKHVLVKFSMKTGQGGNYFYIDDVNIGCAHNDLFDGISESAISSVNLQPNPFNDYTTLSVTAKRNLMAKIIVTSSIGQIVSDRDIQLTAGANNLILDEFVKMKNGVYFVTLRSKKGTLTKKIIKF